MRLYVIPGHGDGDPGAGGVCDGVYYFEDEQVRELAAAIKRFGGDNVVLSDFLRNVWKDNGIATWGIPSDCQVVELHMDSAGVGARGGHVIIKAGFTADEYDNRLADLMRSVFPGRANVIVGRGDLKSPNVAASRGIPYRLVENGFISDENDLRTFRERIDEIAVGYLKAFGIPVVGGETVTPEPPAESMPDYTEAPGDSTDDFVGGLYYCRVDGLRIRKSPSLSGEVIEGVTYDKGEAVVLDDWYTVADGYVWGRYTGGETGEHRYVAVGKHTGKPETDDYLVKS